MHLQLILSRNFTSLHWNKQTMDCRHFESGNVTWSSVDQSDNFRRWRSGKVAGGAHALVPETRDLRRGACVDIFRQCQTSLGTSPVETSLSHFADTFFLINHISAVIFSLEEASCYSSLNRFRSIPLTDSRFLEAWYCKRISKRQGSNFINFWNGHLWSIRVGKGDRGCKASTRSSEISRRWSFSTAAGFESFSWHPLSKQWVVSVWQVFFFLQYIKLMCISCSEKKP